MPSQRRVCGPASVDGVPARETSNTDRLATPGRRDAPAEFAQAGNGERRGKTTSTRSPRPAVRPSTGGGGSPGPAGILDVAQRPPLRGGPHEVGQGVGSREAADLVASLSLGYLRKSRASSRNTPASPASSCFAMKIVVLRLNESSRVSRRALVGESFPYRSSRSSRGPSRGPRGSGCLPAPCPARSSETACLPRVLSAREFGRRGRTLGAAAKTSTTRPVPERRREDRGLVEEVLEKVLVLARHLVHVLHTVSGARPTREEGVRLRQLCREVSPRSGKTLRASAPPADASPWSGEDVRLGHAEVEE